MDLIKAIAFYNRQYGDEWSCGETYDSLYWFGENKPTMDQLEQAWNDYLAEYEQFKYRELRAADYPSIVDQLDLLYHGGYDGWKTRIQETKDKYPKPQLSEGV